MKNRDAPTGRHRVLGRFPFHRTVALGLRRAEALGLRRTEAVCLSALVSIAVVGCAPDQAETSAVPKNATSPALEPPLVRLNTAVATGRWNEAWSLRREVLIEHPDDPEVLTTLSKVAFANGERDASAEFLLDAVRAEDFENSARVKQTVIALTATGRVFEAIDVLEETIGRDPSQHELRRWLFDFLTSLEQHDVASPHGRQLVKVREMDFALLLELSNTERRKLENDSTDLLAERNPSEKRYRIAKAKVLFDRGEYAAAEELLQEIILASPEFLPAQLLLGRLLVDRGSFQDLAEWSRSLPPDHQKSWTYWMVLGDWARNAGDVPGAARAYWESTRRNPDVVQVWAKLASVLNQLPKEAALELDVDLASIQRRANLLSAFYAQKDRFERSNRKSKRVVYEIVSTLRQLGRLWEAEAWAALGMTIAKPSEESPSGESLNALRASIVPSLRRDTPWHLADGIDSSAGGIEGFSIPVFESSKDNPSVEADLASGPSSEIQLENRATSLGLTFFGRTRDDLDQAGIPIYAELGCGGGAIDFDLDGWPDVYLMDAGGTPPTRASRSNALFRNTSGRFTNVVSPSRTADFGFGQGVTVGDVNADGFPDLLLLNYGTNTLLINQGDGTFVRSSDETLRSHSAWSTSGAIADLDGDGLPEVIVLQYCAGTNPVTELCTDAATGITKSCAPIHFPADGDRVLDQTGMGVLKDVTERWSFEPEIAGRGLGLLVGDLDGKTGLDVLVANDMTNNHFYSFGAPSSDRFSESGMLRGLACDDRSNPQASMGIAAGDLDRDGDLDFFVTNFENEYNTLYEQRAIGTWQDRTAKKGLAESTLPQLGFGTEAVDLDHDGSLELVVSNGHVNVPVDDEDSDYTQPMQIFRRSASQRFGPATVNGSSYLATKHVGRSLWTLDANRDGRMDLAVTHQTEPVALLINQTESPHHWIELHLRGVHCGRDAIGAKVNVRAGSQEAYATLLTGDGFQCSNQRVLNIGLGASTLKVVIDITWPDGTEESYSSLDIDTRWMLIQGQGVHRLD